MSIGTSGANEGSVLAHDNPCDLSICSLGACLDGFRLSTPRMRSGRIIVRPDGAPAIFRVSHRVIRQLASTRQPNLSGLSLLCISPYVSMDPECQALSALSPFVRHLVHEGSVLLTYCVPLNRAFTAHYETHYSDSVGEISAYCQ